MNKGNGKLARYHAKMRESIHAGKRAAVRQGEGMGKKGRGLGFLGNFSRLKRRSLPEKTGRSVGAAGKRSVLPETEMMHESNGGDAK